MHASRFAALFGRGWLRPLAFLLWLALLQGCGGGGSGSGDAVPVTQPPAEPAPLVAPSITAQPASTTAREGGSVTLSVSAAGSAPLTYQWQKDGNDVGAASSSTLVLSNLQLSDAQAQWRVRVSNAAGTSLSQTTTLRVTLRIGDDIGTVAGVLPANWTISDINTTPSSDGTGTGAVFRSITGLAVDSQGNTYAASRFAVRKITPAGVVTTIAGQLRDQHADYFNSDAPSDRYADGPGAGARFYRLRGIAVDAGGVLYVADELNHAIRRISPDGTVSTLVGGPGKAGRIDGPLTQARLNHPIALTLDRMENVYVLDAIRLGCLDNAPGGEARVYSDFAIRKISPAGQVSTLAGSAVPGQGLAGGLAVDGDGNVYHSVIKTRVGGIFAVGCGAFYDIELSASYIRKIQPDGNVSLLAGSDADVPKPTRMTPVDGPAATARFLSAVSLAWDGSGFLYVADADNRSVRRVSLATGAVDTVAGRFPVSGELPTVAPGPLPGQLLYTDTLTVGPDGTLSLGTGDVRGRLLLKTSRR